MKSYYSGRGDQGTTTLFGRSERQPKTDPIFEALGCVDELNCWLGFCRVYVAVDEAPQISSGFQGILRRLQEHLFIIQAQLGGAEQALGGEELAEVENMIKPLAEALPPVSGFTIPGESAISAVLDIARAQARRAERAITAVQPAPEIAAYINRLSSLLFVMARQANSVIGKQENRPSYH